MAKRVKKKKATAKKSSSKKTTLKTAKKRATKKELDRARLAEEEELREEGTLTIIFGTIVSLFFAVFITLSLMDKCGPVGDFIKRILLSVFGTCGYLFPLVILFSVIINITYKKNINLKIYMIIVLYVCIICILDNYFNEYELNADVQDMLSNNIERALNNGIAFENGLYSSGILGGFIVILLVRSVNRVGAFTVLTLISVLSFLIIFGSKIIGVIKKIVISILLFIPNLILKLMKGKDEEEESEEDDPKKVLYQEDFKERYEKLYDKPRDPEVELLKEFDFNFNENYDNAFDRKVEKNNINKDLNIDDSSYKNNDNTISSSEIQSRFFNVNESKEDKEKKKLLNTIKKRSINEVMEKNDDISPDSFFYNTGNEDFIINTDNKPYVDNNVDNAYDEMEVGYGRERAKESILNDKYIKKKDIDESRVSSKVVKDNKNDNEVKSQNSSNSYGTKVRRFSSYKFPPMSYLERSARQAGVDKEHINELKNILVETLKQFDIGVEVTNITVGPKVTRFELKPAIGVRVSKILSFHDDLKLALAATDIRIEAPIPGKSVIGIEVPNKTSQSVLLGDIISSPQFRNAESKLSIAIGKDISGEIIVADIRKMPHMLVAGATGSGKSVFINTLIMSLIYKSSPDDVKLIMVDPKRVELQGYEKIPHLLIPVVTNPKKANSALNWAVGEMERRYNMLVNENVRDIESYNELVLRSEDGELEKMPYIVIIIDEFADLMMTSSKDVENSIMRIAQLARACGIYLVIATQRPSVKVISGSIKANIPSRISFAVSSYVDSMTILDRRGAENLLGNGDMLYMPQGQNDPKRVQGCYVSSAEIDKAVSFISQYTDHEFSDDIESKINDDMNGLSDSSQGSYDENEKDDLYMEVGKFIIESNQSSIGALQRRFKLGFNRAARIIDQLERNGVVGPQEGKKAREILMSYEEFLESNNG